MDFLRQLLDPRGGKKEEDGKKKKKKKVRHLTWNAE